MVFGRSRLNRQGGIELESRLPIEATRAGNHDIQILKQLAINLIEDCQGESLDARFFFS